MGLPSKMSRWSLSGSYCSLAGDSMRRGTSMGGASAQQVVIRRWPSLRRCRWRNHHYPRHCQRHQKNHTRRHRRRWMILQPSIAHHMRISPWGGGGGGNSWNLIALFADCASGKQIILSFSSSSEEKSSSVRDADL